MNNRLQAAISELLKCSLVRAVIEFPQGDIWVWCKKSAYDPVGEAVPQVKELLSRVPTALLRGHDDSRRMFSSAKAADGVITYFPDKKQKLSKLNTPPQWLLASTFQINYNPNCAKVWQVRLCGPRRATIDGKQLGESKDAVGWGSTLQEAAEEAKKVYDRVRILQKKGVIGG